MQNETNPTSLKNIRNPRLLLADLLKQYNQKGGMHKLKAGSSLVDPFLAHAGLDAWAMTTEIKYFEKQSEDNELVLKAKAEQLYEVFDREVEWILIQNKDFNQYRILMTPNEDRTGLSVAVVLYTPPFMTFPYDSLRRGIKNLEFGFTIRDGQVGNNIDHAIRITSRRAKQDGEQVHFSRQDLSNPKLLLLDILKRYNEKGGMTKLEKDNPLMDRIAREEGLDGWAIHMPVDLFDDAPKDLKILDAAAERIHENLAKAVEDLKFKNPNIDHARLIWTRTEDNLGMDIALVLYTRPMLTFPFDTMRDAVAELQKDLARLDSGIMKTKDNNWTNFMAQRKQDEPEGRSGK